MTATVSPAHTPKPKDWVAIGFLTLTPIIGIVGTALYTWRVGFEPWMLVLLLVMYLLVGLSICAGYHRYFSHKSYECAPAVQVFYAVFGAHGGAELDPRLVRRPSPPSPLRRRGLGSVQHQARLLVGAHPVDLRRSTIADARQRAGPAAQPDRALAAPLVQAGC